MNKKSINNYKIKLLNDHSVAELLDVSVAWVRLQKHLRKHGKEHSLAVDPILMGKTRRYRLSDIEEWLAKQGPE